MPMYEYKCNKCGEIFSLFRSALNAEAKAMCPKCKDEDVEKIISSFSLKASSASCGTAKTGLS
jgi:putative FmdB family regulatory protein